MTTPARRTGHAPERFALLPDDEIDLVHVAFHDDRSKTNIYGKAISTCRGGAVPEEHLLLHQCDNSFGSSGSPLLMRDSAADYSVAGIHNTGFVNFSDEEQTRSQAILMDDMFLKQFERILAEVDAR